MQKELAQNINRYLAEDKCAVVRTMERNLKKHTDRFRKSMLM